MQLVSYRPHLSLSNHFLGGLVEFEPGTAACVFCDFCPLVFPLLETPLAAAKALLPLACEYVGRSGQLSLR